MATFTYAQLEGLALGAGFSTSLAPTMAAIAMAESSGCQYALAAPQDVRPVKECRYRYTTGEQSYGLWQINIGVGTPPDLRLFDPHYNALAAASKFEGQGLRAWSTYRDKSYLQFLRQGELPATIPYTPPPSRRRSSHAPAAWADLMRSLQHGLVGSLYTTRRVRRNLRRRIR